MDTKQDKTKKDISAWVKSKSISLPSAYAIFISFSISLFCLFKWVYDVRSKYDEKLSKYDEKISELRLNFSELKIQQNETTPCNLKDCLNLINEYEKTKEQIFVNGTNNSKNK